MNDRELATLIWFGLLALWALSIGGVRRALPGIAQALFTLTLLAPLALMAAYVAGLLFLGAELGIWNSALAVDTTVWALLTGVMLFGKSVAVFTRRGSFKSLLAVALGVTVLVEGFVNLYVFPLPIELLLVPITVVLGAFSVVAATRDEYATIKRLVDLAIAVIGCTLILYVVLRLATGWDEFDTSTALQKLALPIWLTLGTLPVVALLGLWANYDTAFSLIRWASDDPRARRRARLALILGLHVRARDISAFNGMWCKRLARATTWSEAQTVMRSFREHRLLAT